MKATKKQNINSQLFVTMLTACLGLLIVSSPSQAQAKNLIREELVRVYVSENSSSEDSTKDVNAKTNLRRFVRRVQNLLNDFTFNLSAKQQNDFALGFFALPRAEVFNLPQTSFFSYQGKSVSISNNHTLTVSNLARASL